MNELTEQQRNELQRYGFDMELQKRWQKDVAEGRLSRQTNAVSGDLLAPPPGTVHMQPGSATKAHRELEAIGREAIRAGQLGVVVLNGGMATRFGGVVKGVVPVRDDRSFLGLAIDNATRVAREAGGRIRILLMNSFATDEATRRHFAEHDHFGADAADIEHFTQFVQLRMTESGELFRHDDGRLSPFGPGHGDFAPAIRASGCLQRFVDDGGKYVFVRNVDNLGALADPAVLGHHIRSGREVTCELAPKHDGDVGGAPYLYRGRVQLVEQIRYPDGFDASVVDVFNCNTMTFTAAALTRPVELGRYYVQKNVEGRAAVQIEHLIGEMTAHLTTNWLRIPREGARSRFLPIKKPDELQTMRADIDAVCGR
ncbi:MAG: UTP--glucose-1-phosphate uridylyltransferase [Planctomycetes bacterium]|nr:UTP--glucose-1-phosphate uridylyltransferase [Planctomycetota bacterium]